jgi:ketosteroid isomerase-like protein
MHPMILAVLLAVLPQGAASPATPAAARGATASDDLAAEVQRAVAAYNARDLSYYENALDPQSTYIAEDGGVIAGRERVLRTFGRIFTADPPRRLEISDLVVTRRGDTGWALFRWTMTAGADARQGVTSVLFARGDNGGWRPQLIQNTLRAHGGRPAAAMGTSPSAAASASPQPSPSPR